MIIAAIIHRSAMEWYAVGEWKDFYVAVSGAAAAFAGLLFVGLSINLTRIISLPGISDRAGETLIFLGAVLVAALLGLVPQASAAFGIELLCIFLFRVVRGDLSRYSSAAAPSLRHALSWIPALRVHASCHTAIDDRGCIISVPG